MTTEAKKRESGLKISALIMQLDILVDENKQLRVAEEGNERKRGLEIEDLKRQLTALADEKTELRVTEKQLRILLRTYSLEIAELKRGILADEGKQQPIAEEGSGRERGVTKAELKAQLGMPEAFKRNHPCLSRRMRVKGR